MASAGQQMVGSEWTVNPVFAPPGVVTFDSPPPPAWPRHQRPNFNEQLSRAVQRDIVPRLAIASRGPLVKPVALPLSASVEEFSALVLGKDPASMLDFAQAACDRGASIEAVCLELLSPAARHLGDLWTDDLVDFTQVTTGLGRLHGVMRELSVPIPALIVSPADDHRALLVPAPGEQHTFGLAMVVEFFRRAAWGVWSGAGGDLTGIVRKNWFSVVGFSLGYEGRLAELRTSIRRVRQASRNPHLSIMVGGPVFIEHPEFVAQVGADAMAVDGRQAVMQAQCLLTLQPA